VTAESVLPRCGLNDLGRTAVERASNDGHIEAESYFVTTALPIDQHRAVKMIKISDCIITVIQTCSL